MKNVQLVDLELYDNSTTVQGCLHVFDVDGIGPPSSHHITGNRNLGRGKRQKRVGSKVWSVLYTDRVSTAVQIESMYGYDTDIFMLALMWFASERGRPQKLYSNPGSQLVGAKRELNNAMSKSRSENGFEWILGTPDAP